MNATDLLAHAMATGRLTRGAEVSVTTHPGAARTYLADGTGLSWQIPSELRARGGFVLDAEIVAPVRASLVRRFGVTDAETFARAWTRVEVWAKLLDVPVITWLARHGLDEPNDVRARRSVGEIDWATRRSGELVTTFGVIVTREGEAVGADGHR